MKKCPWCGKSFPDNATVCDLDHNALEFDGSIPPPSAQGKPENIITEGTSGDQTTHEAVTEDQVDEANLDPAEFCHLVTLDPFEADQLLTQFEEAGIQFQIDRVETRVPTSRGAYRSMGTIEIFVRRDNLEKASKILTAKWIV